MEQPASSYSAATPALPLAHDEELIARICLCQEAALGVLYDRYYRLVFAVALRIVGDRELAEEVVQDVFQAAWQSAGGYQMNGSVAAWLVGIARHRAIDATRSRRFRARTREDLLDDRRLAGDAGLATADTERLLLRTVVVAALAALPSTQRQAIELGYYGGLTHAEIATRLGEPIGTIKSRVRIGLIKLRELLVLEEM